MVSKPKRKLPLSKERSQKKKKKKKHNARQGYFVKFRYTTLSLYVTLNTKGGVEGEGGSTKIVAQ